MFNTRSTHRIHRVRFAGGSGLGTRFGIFGIVRRYAKIALMSESVKLAYDAHGIGGKMSRFTAAPICLPFRMALTNVSSVHAAIPVGSGVRLVVKDTPHGPDHAVFVSATTMPHPAGVGGAAGTLIGHHMDKQAEELKADLKGAKVQRVGEGIKITFDSG